MRSDVCSLTWSCIGSLEAVCVIPRSFAIYKITRKHIHAHTWFSGWTLLMLILLIVFYQTLEWGIEIRADNLLVLKIGAFYQPNVLGRCATVHPEKKTINKKMCRLEDWLYTAWLHRSWKLSLIGYLQVEPVLGFAYVSLHNKLYPP